MLKPSISSVPLRKFARNGRSDFEDDNSVTTPHPNSDAWQPEFIAIPYKVFRDAELSHAAKLVYGRLRLYGGEVGRAFPKHETLAAEVSIRPRQLRTVLDELRRAGWIEWKRTRTGCLYTVFPDRQKTADQIGRKLPVRSAENCRSGSAENCLQKRSFEYHHQKEELKRRAADGAGRDRGRRMGPSVMDPHPSGERTFTPPAARSPFPNPEMECEARFRERHPDLDAQRLLVMVRSELDGVSVAKFVVEDDRRTTAPESLKNPTGHYRRLARNVRNEEFVVREMERAGPKVVRVVSDLLIMAKDEQGRCAKCNSLGYVKWDVDQAAREYCDCPMGKDVRGADESKARRASATGAQVTRT
jgi:hypothetical protein